MDQTGMHMYAGDARSHIALTVMDDSPGTQV